MTYGELMEAMQKADKYIDRIAQDKTDFTKEEIREMVDIIAMLYSFIEQSLIHFE